MNSSAQTRVEIQQAERWQPRGSQLSRHLVGRGKVLGAQAAVSVALGFVQDIISQGGKFSCKDGFERMSLRFWPRGQSSSSARENLGENSTLLASQHSPDHGRIPDRLSHVAACAKTHAITSRA